MSLSQAISLLQEACLQKQKKNWFMEGQIIKLQFIFINNRNGSEANYYKDIQENTLKVASGNFEQDVCQYSIFSKKKIGKQRYQTQGKNEKPEGNLDTPSRGGV